MCFGYWRYQETTTALQIGLRTGTDFDHRRETWGNTFGVSIAATCSRYEAGSGVVGTAAKYPNSAITLGEMATMSTKKIVCPKCRSSSCCRFMYDIGNCARVLGNGGMFVVAVVLTLIGLGGVVEPLPFDYKRECKECGTRFFALARHREHQMECGRCGYSLTGNVSGTCPECGWRLPARLRRVLRERQHGKADARSQDRVRKGG